MYEFRDSEGNDIEVKEDIGFMRIKNINEMAKMLTEIPMG